MNLTKDEDVQDVSRTATHALASTKHSEHCQRGSQRSSQATMAPRLPLPHQPHLLALGQLLRVALVLLGRQACKLRLVSLQLRGAGGGQMRCVAALPTLAPKHSEVLGSSLQEHAQHAMAHLGNGLVQC